MHFSNVVFPHPDGPTTQTNSPSSIRNETARTACVAFGPAPYVLPTPLSSSIRRCYCGAEARQPRCHESTWRSTRTKSMFRRYPSTPMSTIAAHIGESWKVFFEIRST